jgi:allantoin racemase
MRIWHQSFTALDDVPHYRKALRRHFDAVSGDGVEVELHGMEEQTYPTAYPGTDIGYTYLSNLHKEQFVEAALRADAEGYDAFFIATLVDTGYDEIRTLIDIPVIAYCQASLLIAATLGDRIGIVSFIGALEPQIRRNIQMYGLNDIFAGTVQIDSHFDQIMAAYANPADLLEKFTRAAREAISMGANVIIPGEGPLNVFLADQGISRVDDTPVIDSLGAGIKLCELRSSLHRQSGLLPTRNGYYFDKPSPERLKYARDFYYKHRR